MLSKVIVIYDGKYFKIITLKLKNLYLTLNTFMK